MQCALKPPFTVIEHMCMIQKSLKYFSIIPRLMTLESRNLTFVSIEDLWKPSETVSSNDIRHIRILSLGE